VTVDRIARLRDCGVFHDFSWPAELPEFGRYNLVYGWNWTGKTTISRMLRALERRTAPTQGEVKLSVSGVDIGGDAFPQSTLPIRVFNRDFVNDSVFPTGGGDLPPIFVLGRDSVEKHKLMDERKGQLDDAERGLDSARESVKAAEKALDQFCIDRARMVKDTLRSPGTSPFNNYDKSGFRQRTERMLAEGNKDGSRLSTVERDKALAQSRAAPKPKIQSLSYEIPELSTMLDDVSALLRTTVVSKTIQALREDPALAAWSHEGLRLHRKHNSAECLFCGQPLPDERLDLLEAHFTAEYEEFTKSLDVKARELHAASAATSALVLPDPASFYDDLTEEARTTAALVRTALGETRVCLEALAGVLLAKKSRAFEPVALTVVTPKIDAGIVGRLNEVIDRHNQACDDFERRACDARRSLEADLISESLDEFIKLRDAVQDSERRRSELEAKRQELLDETENLAREVVEHRRSAEELNDDLRKYLGHDELRLEIKDTGYAVTRSGTLATSLSEGEMTAIALLYFLASLHDRRFDLKNGVIVLDDPVSSLDANALYLAFGFIRERTKEAAQLLILTHNFAFFRQVRNWFHHLKGQKKKDVSQRPARLYMLDCERSTDQRCSRIRPLDPLLEEYESEYHYLFSRVYRAANADTTTDLEKNYILPNMARRLIEAFLAFRQPHIAGELWQKLKAVDFDEVKKVRILRFLHTYSHSDAIGEPEHDPSLLMEARPVLQDLMELMRTQDQAHYDSMVKLVTTIREETEDAE
jgi:wobble nucleotide-excising tRNase